MFFIALSISSFAQPIDWLNGKWLAAGEIFEIDGNTIQKTVDGSSIQLGEFIIDEDNCLSVDGKPIGLVISLESQSLSYSTNPEYHFPKYENLSLAPKFSFLIGSWTDGSNVISITEKNIIVKQGDYVVDKGIFFVDDNGFVNAYWEKGNFQDGLIVGGDVLSIEGGDSLIKLPEQSSNAEETSDILSTLTLSSKPYDGDIKWIYGLWKLPDSKAEIYITPKYFQARGANDSYLDGKEITELEKVPYVVKEEDNKLLGTIIKVGDYYLDISSQLLYSLSGLDKRSYLEKTENYVSPLIKYGKWVLLGLIGITALVFLLILLIRLLKKGIFALKQWHLKTKEKLAIKSQEAKNKAAIAAKAQEAKSKATEMFTDAIAKVRSVDVKNRHFSNVHWLLIIGVYFILFLSITIGLIILIPTIAYLIIKKNNPEKAERLLSSCSSLLSPITSRPQLKRGLVLLLIGFLVYRLISPIIGLILILFAIFYLISSKFAKNISERIDRFFSSASSLVKNTWDKTYVKVITCLVLIVLPFFNNTPTHSIATIATPQVEQVLGITHEPESLKESQIPHFQTPFDVISFTSNHTFISNESGIRLSVRHDGVYANGRQLTSVPKVIVFTPDEAQLQAHSPLRNTTYQIDLVRQGNKYILKFSTLPSYSSVENFYMVD